MKNLVILSLFCAIGSVFAGPDAIPKKIEQLRSKVKPFADLKQSLGHANGILGMFKKKEGNTYYWYFAEGETCYEVTIDDAGADGVGSVGWTGLNSENFEKCK